MSNFVIDCINGDALLSEIDDYIDRWHDSDTDLSLHSFLGMTKEEYVLFVEDETYLDYIITAHKENTNIKELYSNNRMPIAARSDNPTKVARIEKWLKTEGLWQ